MLVPASYVVMCLAIAGSRTFGPIRDYRPVAPLLVIPPV